jgi:hypothetical protein
MHRCSKRSGGCWGEGVKQGGSAPDNVCMCECNGPTMSIINTASDPRNPHTVVNQLVLTGYNLESTCPIANYLLKITFLYGS